MNAIKDKILTLEDVAKLKGVNSDRIRIAIQNGDLKATYFHGQWHIRESNYHKYLKNCQHKLHPQKLVTLTQASDILKISQTIILRAIRNGSIKTYEDKQGLKICMNSLLEWDRNCFTKDR